MSPPSPANSDLSAPLALEPVPLSVWDRYVAGSPNGLLFHTGAWLELLVQVYDVAWHPLGIWSGDRLVGLFPLLTRRLGPFRLAGSPLMQAIACTPFMGPLIPTGQISASLVALEEIQRRWKIDHIELSLPVLLQGTTPAMALGYSIEVCQAVVLRLGGRAPGQLWAGLSSSCQRAVRKARASQLVVVEAQNASFLSVYSKMCEEVYRGSGRLPHLSEAFHRKAWQALAAEGKIKAFLAMQAGEIVAGAVFVLHRHSAYYLSGASYDRWLGLRPNNLLQWHFIEWAAGQGYRYYDMGGTVIPGITRFKLSFGGQLQPYSRLYRANSAWARLGRAGYLKAIPIWRRVQACWAAALRRSWV